MKMYVEVNQDNSVKFVNQLTAAGQGKEPKEIEQAYNGTWYLKGYAPVKPQETKEREVRALRDEYLQTYVDPKQMILVWDGLSDDDKRLYAAYRQYLLDYPESSETWFEKEPLKFDDWKEQNSADVLASGGG